MFLSAKKSWTSSNLPLIISCGKQKLQKTQKFKKSNVHCDMRLLVIIINMVVCFFVCLSVVCLLLFLFVYLFVCLFVCLFVFYEACF